MHIYTSKLHMRLRIPRHIARTLSALNLRPNISLTLASAWPSNTDEQAQHKKQQY
jgi:hypothetical protein